MRRDIWLALTSVAAVVSPAVAIAAAFPLFDPAPYNTFVKGVTTRAEVLAALGPPVKEQTGPQGQSMLMYQYVTNLPDMPEIAILVMFSADGFYRGIDLYKKDA